MIQDDDPHIIYTPNKSITTQKLRGKRVNDAIKNTSIFLENCTNINFEDVSSCELVSYSPYNSDDNPEIALQFLKEITELFGTGKTSPMAYRYSDGKPSEDTSTEWKLNPSQLNAAISYISNKYPLPKYTFGPVQLVISYFFKLVDLKTKEVLSNQPSDSHLMIWLSRNFSCSPTLLFPFEFPNKEFTEYLSNIKTFTPFELKDDYLRTVKSNKAKTGFIYKKL